MSRPPREHKTSHPAFRVLLVRHGETQWNLERRLQGFVDTALSPLGLRQIEALADRLAGEPIARVFSSDLKRAMLTAECAARRFSLPITEDARLREQNFGQWEGAAWDLLLKPGSASFREYLTNLDFRPPDGESRRELLARVAAFFADLAAGAAPDETVLVVSHGGPTLLWTYQVLGIPFDREKRFRTSNTGINEFVFEHGAWILATLDDTLHLRAMERQRSGLSLLW